MTVLRTMQELRRA